MTIKFTFEPPAFRIYRVSAPTGFPYSAGDPCRVWLREDCKWSVCEQEAFTIGDVAEAKALAKTIAEGEPLSATIGVLDDFQRIRAAFAGKNAQWKPPASDAEYLKLLAQQKDDAVGSKND